MYAFDIHSWQAKLTVNDDIILWNSVLRPVVVASPSSWKGLNPVLCLTCCRDVSLFDADWKLPNVKHQLQGRGEQNIHMCTSFPSLVLCWQCSACCIWCSFVMSSTPKTSRRRLIPHKEKVLEQNPPVCSYINYNWKQTDDEWTGTIARSHVCVTGLCSSCWI